MQAHELSREGQADAKTTLGAGVVVFGLLEEIKHLVEHRRLDADAGIAHADLHGIRADLRRQYHCAARRGVTGGVVEEVADGLGDAHFVDVEHDRRRGQSHVEVVISRIQRR